MVFWILLSLLSALVLASPLSNAPCMNPKIRKEWRSLSVPERKDYIRAVSCLMDSPAKSKKYFSVVQNRYDDFVALHANSTGGGLKMDGFKGLTDMVANPLSMAATMTRGIHGTGVFLPWHRYALSTYEDALRDECGLKIGHPYWDWHLDTPEAGGSWNSSPIFDPISGFGGNGARVNMSSMMPPGIDQGILATLARLIPGFDMQMAMGTGGGCVLDGPFKNRTLVIGPMGQMTPNNTRCLTRSMNDKMAHESASSKSIRKLLGAKTMTEFRTWIETGSMSWSVGLKGLNITNEGGDMHNLGHGGIGGEMVDVFNSANDPLFFMHHMGMDRLWSLWQDQDPKRITDVGKPTGFFDLAPLKLDSMLWMGFAAPDRHVSEVMDPLNRDGSGVLCYKYEGSSFKSYFS